MCFGHGFRPAAAAHKMAVVAAHKMAAAAAPLQIQI